MNVLADRTNALRHQDTFSLDKVESREATAEGEKREGGEQGSFENCVRG